MAAGAAACGVKEALILLGLPTGASRSAVESAFRRRALRCHPDRHPKDPLAKARFLRLSRAKELLLSAAEKVFTKPKQPTFTSRDTAEQKRRAQEHAKRERERQRAEERLKQREAEARARKKREEEASAEAEQRRAALRAEEERRERIAAAERQRAEIFEAYRRKRSAQSAEAAPQVPLRSGSRTPAPVRADPAVGQRPGAALSDRHRQALKRLEKRRAGGEGFEVPCGSWWVHDLEVDQYLLREALYGFP
ncbi:ATJ39 [Symbiodinium sp. CCMP2592]|nr:ATJ39 [Symbiodinium sp. CCMP2592]